MKINFYYILFALLLLDPSCSTAGNSDKPWQTSKPWLDPEWLRLMHYRRIPWSGHYVSEADNSLFFISDHGRSNPRAEFEASLSAVKAELEGETSTGSYTHPMVPYLDDKLQNIPHSERSFRCVFPQRYNYIRKFLENDAQPTVPCQRYEQWRNKLAAQSVTLVFASAYLGNPASTFGHTFLRLNSGKDPLLDYGVNYAAAVATGQGFDYAIMGIFGGFAGAYSLMPYHVKVQEYAQGESRDLWEYPLNLNTTEIHRLLGHLWELGLFSADYYFFRRNCSYEILTLLEYARPTLDLTSTLPAWVIPTETLRRALDQGQLAAGEPTVRPALSSRVLGQISRLTPQQSRLFRATLKAERLPDSTNIDSYVDSFVLDTLIEYLEYKKKTSKKNELPPGTARLYREVLLARAKQPQATSSLDLAIPSPPPHLGHRIFRAALGYGTESDHGPFVTLELRPALHELVSRSEGYSDGLEIEIPKAVMRYSTSHDENKLRLERFDFARVTALSDITHIMGGLSWSGGFGLQTRRDIDCGLCTHGYAELGIGPSVLWQWRERNWSLQPLALLDVVGHMSGRYQRGFRLGSGATLGSLLRLGPFAIEGRGSYRILPIGQGRYGWSPQKDNRYFEAMLKINLALMRDLELRSEFYFSETSNHGFAALGYYF
jgi:hypothetical protein